MAKKTNIRIGLFGYGRSNAGVLGAMRKRFPALRLVLRCDAPPSALPEFSDGIEVEYRCGAEAERNIDEDILFLSPSVRPDRPALLEAEARGVTISSDAKMFFSGLPAFGVSPFSGVRLAVTGSDGKSSVTALTAAMTGGIACGNFGRSFSSVPDGAIAVCELSSFQLTAFVPQTDRAAITNITENHLNWHTSFEEYRAAKESLFAGARERVLCADSAGLGQIAAGGDFFCACSPTARGDLRETCGAKHSLTLRGDDILLDGAFFTSIRGAKCDTGYAKENFLTAAALSLGYAGPERIGRAIREFCGLAHRAQYVDRYGSVRFFDSSIDSTPARTLRTLSGMRGRPVVILGGRGKGLSYAPLGDALPAIASAAVLLGENERELRRALGDLPCAAVRTMDEAIAAAWDLSGGREDILLSPAATSFDRYRDFEERGEDFARAVAEWKKRMPPASDQ